MLSDYYFSLGKKIMVKILEVLGVTFGKTKPQRLVKVTIIEPAVPAHTDQVSTHKAFKGLRVKGLTQQPLVGLKAVFLFESFSKTPQGGIGQDKKPIETNSVSLGQLLAIGLFEAGLRRRKLWPLGIEDKV